MHRNGGAVAVNAGAAAGMLALGGKGCRGCRREADLELHRLTERRIFCSLGKAKPQEQVSLMHRHLPGIPSAAEVQQKGGVEVGQMTAKLLEKLEELTLYLLQMHARQRELERENIALRQQLEQLQTQTMISSPMSHNPRGQR
jgi:hypothetical protein